MKRLLKFVLLALFIPVGLGGGYVLAGWGLAKIPVNGHYAAPREGITIGAIDNGVHTDLILPVVAGDTDWRTIFAPSDFTRLPAPPGDGHYMVVGWGHRDFFLNTPEWSDLTPATALRALFGLGGTLLHVYYPPAPPRGDGVVWTRVSPAAHGRIVAAIKASARRDANGRARVLAGAGYGPWDAFFDADGSYGPFNTCNAWTSRILARAGLRTGWWTPFSGAIADHLRAAAGTTEFPVHGGG